MVKIHSMVRHQGEDTTEFSLLGNRYRLIARPVSLWKYFYWGKWGSNDQRYWGQQSPWMTLLMLKKEFIWRLP